MANSPREDRLACLQEPAKGARAGHPRAVPYSKLSSEDRTELQIYQEQKMLRKLLVNCVFG